MLDKRRINSRTFICQTCGKSFTRRLSFVKKGNKLHCSLECRKRTTYGNCKTCGKQIKIRPSVPRIYCSLSCFAKDRKGKRNIKWKGGVTKKAHKVRTTDKYYAWQQFVFMRDNWTCQMCNKRGGKLESDHIIPLADLINNNPNEFDCQDEYFYDTNNGQTLCKDCHKIKTKAYYHNLAQLNKRVNSIESPTEKVGHIEPSSQIPISSEKVRRSEGE
jgi:5-methylcytosine-specific restriction endonuclease McrA